jgi:hypothetical protein
MGLDCGMAQHMFRMTRMSDMVLGAPVALESVINLSAVFLAG